MAFFHERDAILLRLGVLSDTHVQSLTAARNLADLLLNGVFSGVDAILHAGDQVSPELESCFAPLPWYAVRGNMDFFDSDLPERRILPLAGWRIGMVHGWGSPQGIEARVLSCFADDSIDVLIFGHSHQPVCRKQGSLLLLNPGSATDRRHAPCHSVGLLSLGDEINAEIVTLD